MQVGGLAWHSSHRRGHWFDPSIAHQRCCRSDTLLMIFIGGVSVVWGADGEQRSLNTLRGPKCSRDIRGLIKVRLRVLAAAEVPALLQCGEHRLAHGGGDVGVEVVDVLALVPEALQAQYPRYLVFDEPGLVGVAQIVEMHPLLDWGQPGVGIAGSNNLSG